MHSNRHEPRSRTAAEWRRGHLELPAVSGAYALLLTLDRAVALPPRFGGTAPAGLYCYLGSARGPAGIRARCARHFRRGDSRHWHVDWLSAAAGRIAALAFPDTEECALVERLVAQAWSTVPVPGFGSSDCRRCRAHLVRVAADPATIAHVLQTSPAQAGIAGTHGLTDTRRRRKPEME